MITARLKSYSIGSDLTLNLTRWGGQKLPSAQATAIGVDRTDEIEQELTNLKNKAERGAITLEEYETLKQYLLNAFSGN